jgi:CheY-like chemotaxis protein
VRTILLVRGNDDHELEATLGCFLHGYRLKSVTSLPEALETLKRGIVIPLVLLFDVPLSVAGVRELTRQLQAVGVPTTETGVVLMTDIPEAAHDGIADELCVCCVRKPVDLDRLRVLLDTLVDAVSSETEPVSFTLQPTLFGRRFQRQG